MAITLADSGTLSTTVGGGQSSLGGVDTTVGFYQLYVDLNAMADGSSTNAPDEIVIRVKLKCLTGGTQRVAKVYVRKFSQEDLFFVSDTFVSDIEIEFSLEHVAGVSLSAPWKILRW